MNNSTTPIQPLVVLEIVGEKTENSICKDVIMEKLSLVIKMEHQKGNPPLKIQPELWKKFNNVIVPAYSNDFIGIYPVEPMLNEKAVFDYGSQQGAIVRPNYFKALNSLAVAVNHGILKRTKPLTYTLSRLIVFFELQTKNNEKTQGSFSAMRYPDNRLYISMNLNFQSCVYPKSATIFTY